MGPTRRTTVATAVAAIAFVPLVAGCRPFVPGGGDAPEPTATPPVTAAPTSTSAPTTPAPIPTPTTTPPQPTTIPTTAPPTGPQLGAEAAEVVRLTNVERATAGCRPLAVDSRLSAAAQAHSADMAAKNYFSHTGQNGSTPGQRAVAAGYPEPYVGENIAAGSATAAATVQMWMGSDGHRRNILNCDYTVIGVGYATGGSYRYYWTQDFGSL